jgi:hypothetical protein
MATINNNKIQNKNNKSRAVQRHRDVPVRARDDDAVGGLGAWQLARIVAVPQLLHEPRVHCVAARVCRRQR